MHGIRWFHTNFANSNLSYVQRRMVSQITALAIKKLDNFMKSPVVFQIKLEFTKKIWYFHVRKCWFHGKMMDLFTPYLENSGKTFYINVTNWFHPKIDLYAICKIENI